MSETSPATPSMGAVTFRIRDDLPPVCVICGEAATGQSSQPVPISADTTGTALSLLQLVSGFFGIFLRQRTSPRKSPDHKYVRLPHCTNHSSPDNLRAAVRIVAMGPHRVELTGVSPKFQKAVAALDDPPTEEFLGSLDAGTATDTDKFLSDIDTSDVPTADDFLRKLNDE